MAELGKCRYGSVKELDQNYHFLKKRRQDTIASHAELTTWSSLKNFSKQGSSLTVKSVMKHRRIETVGQLEQGVTVVKRKRKHQSMDEFVSLSPQESPYQKTYKGGLTDKWATRALREPLSGKKHFGSRGREEEPVNQVRQKIQDLKSNLQREKQEMKRKVTIKGSRIDKIKFKKKTCSTSPNKKSTNRKIKLRVD